MSLIWQIGGALFIVAVCFIAVRGIHARHLEKIRGRLIYGPKKVKRKDSQ
jgi:hypothetical protein